MTKSPWVAWFLLCVWSLWASAVEARLSDPFGPFAPALGLMLVLGLAARLSTGQSLGLALVGTCGCAALCTQPIAAVFATFLGALFFLRVVRSALDVTSPLVLAVATGVAVFGAEAWGELVRETRLVHGLALADGALWRSLATAVSSGVAMLLVGPAIAYLPGVTPLKRNSPWSNVASVR
ncbi:MAG: hypothetical protein HZA52_01795 [Planctomycetes bacterium]|nr:hypothetical protein [Planctomycetota bacterium]